MHRKLFAYLFVAALLSSAVVVFADSDSSDATTPTTVTGYLGMPGSPENIPATGMEITLTDADNEEKSITTTVDADGKFSFTLTGTVLEGKTILHIVFGDEDYRAQNLPLHVSRLDGTSHLKLDMSDIDDSVCNLGSNMDQAMLLVLGKSDVEFTVKGTDRFLVNAMITLEDTDSHQEFSGETGTNGKYKFTDLPYGTYNAKITCNGYQTVNEKTIPLNGATTHSVTMVEKEIPTFYGMTTYHALMLVGIIAGLVLFSVSYIMVRHNSKGIKD